MINIYKLEESSGSFSLISSDDFDNPATFNIAPGGSALTKKFYIRNDDPTKYYTGLVLHPSVNGSAIAGTSLRVKLLSGDKQPSDTRWSAVAANGSLSESDPGDAAVLQSPLDGGPIDTRLPNLGTAAAPDTRYYPFWIRVEAAKGSPIGALSCGLTLTYTEHLVDD
jgi:hypothetical protein